MNIEGLITVPGAKYSGGIGYITIPTDLDRSRYVKDCFLNNWVSIITSDGAFCHRVPISPDVLNFIEFPEKASEIGSRVGYVKDERYNSLFIVTRFQPDGIGDQKEHEFKFSRRLGDSVIEIRGSVKDKSLNILVQGESAELNFNVYSEKENAKVNVGVQGDVKVFCTGSTLIEQKQIDIITEDEEDESSIKQSPKEIRVNSSKVTFNDGEEAMVLGNKLKSFLSSFVTSVSNIKTMTKLGPQPILNKAEVVKLKAQIDELVSKDLFVK